MFKCFIMFKFLLLFLSLRILCPLYIPVSVMLTHSPKILCPLVYFSIVKRKIVKRNILINQIYHSFSWNFMPTYLLLYKEKQIVKKKYFDKPNIHRQRYMDKIYKEYIIINGLCRLYERLKSLLSVI